MKVNFSIKLMEQIQLLQDSHRDLEWGGYIIGNIVDGEINCDYMYVCDQEVTSTVVDLQPNFQQTLELSNLNIIGWLHSHNTMGVTPSSQDVRQNAKCLNDFGVNLMVIVNNRMDISMEYSIPDFVCTNLELDKEFYEFDVEHEHGEIKRKFTTPRATNTFKRDYGKYRVNRFKPEDETEITLADENAWWEESVHNPDNWRGY